MEIYTVRAIFPESSQFVELLRLKGELCISLSADCPRRNEIDGSQELFYPGNMRAIADIGIRAWSRRSLFP